jgi:hypothetical protein
MARFQDLHLDRAFRFSLGVDATTGGHYLATPISGWNRAVE